jgi:hypothetical protein
VSRCQWLTDPEIGRWFLPGCMGGAVYGESQCTCGPPAGEPDGDEPTIEDRLTAIETQLQRLAAALEQKA